MKLRDDESLPEGLKRIAREELDTASAALEGGAPRAEQVHEVRKSLKKARATLRLVRLEVGEEFFKRENRRLRDAGRLVSPLRDAEVAIATLDGLAGSYGLGRSDLRPLRAELAKRRDRARSEAMGDGRFELLAQSVSEARGMVDAWPISRVDSGAFEPSLRKTYKRGRRAFAGAYEKPTPERFHELRKRVKNLWYYARILKPCAAGEIGELKALTDEAADLLGIDHDLSFLSSIVLGRGGALARADLDPDERARLRRLIPVAIEQERLRIQRRALGPLRSIFAEAATDFAARIASRADCWRLGLDPQRTEWLTPAAADRLRELLASKAEARGSDANKVRRELRSWGLDLERLRRISVSRTGTDPSDLDELIDRGLVRVGGAADLGSSHVSDGLRRIAVEVAPNEASGICPITTDEVLDGRGWDVGFWVVLDGTTIDRGIVAVGRRREDFVWEVERPPMSVRGSAPADDAEDCVQIGQWTYAFGSHYGSKEGPIERERQFVARFRERDLTEGEIDLEVVCTEYRLHRLLNEGLADSQVTPFPLAQSARAALVGSALEAEQRDDDGFSARIEPDDLPINIEGCALRRRTGGVLVGLRFPTSAAGHPLIVEVDHLERLFEPNGDGDGPDPEVSGVWELTGVGNRFVPAGIRGLSEGDGDRIEALTGNLDSSGKGSVLIEAHPEAALATSAHFSVALPGRSRGGDATCSLVREFSGAQRVEGVARDRSGRFFYVIDDEGDVEMRSAEPALS